MSVLSFPIAILMSTTASYLIDQSIRFNDDDSAYMYRTPSIAGNRKTWTWSGWVKRANLASHLIFSQGADASNCTRLGFYSNNALRLIHVDGGSVTTELLTMAVYEDPSAWMHVVVVWDSTNGTADDRHKIYVNGDQVTDFATRTNPALNKDSNVNSTDTFYLGARTGTPDQFLDGSLADVRLVDGTDLSPSDFGKIDGEVWVPKAFTGSYGTNGFHIDGANSGDLGNDVSGNATDFTTSGLASADQMPDSPTDDIENGIGNYCVWNPNDYGPVSKNTNLKNGNLQVVGTGAGDADISYRGTIGVQGSGKYYFEVSGTARGSSFGIMKPVGLLKGSWPLDTEQRALRYDSQKVSNGSSSAYGSDLWGASDVIGCAVDLDNGAIYFSNNNTWYNSGDPESGASKTGAAFTDLGSDTWLPYFHHGDYQAWDFDFGQNGFAYTPPAGYVGIGTHLLPEPTPAVSVTPITSPSFTGNANADGPCIWLGYTPDTSGTSTINGSTITWGTHAIPLAGGFKVITSSASYNSTGTNTISIAVEAPFGGAGVSQVRAR